MTQHKSMTRQEKMILEPELQLHKFISVDDHVELLQKAILSGNCDINEVDSKGFSSLHWAVFFRKDSVVELLTQLNVDPFIRDNEYGYTPLDYAVGQDANPNAAKTILSAYPPDRICELLRSSNNDGDTSLHIAASFGIYPCVLMLIQKGALASAKNRNGKLPIDLCPDDADQRVLANLEKTAMKEELSRCWECAKLSHYGTKRCSRCHYARYCDRNCQVAHWRTHQKNCEPVVLAKADGHILPQLFADTAEVVPSFIFCNARVKNGNIKDITVGTVKDMNEWARDVYREYSDGKHNKTEFTVEVQSPHNVERGPLLVTDLKRRLVAFVSPNERGYDLLCNKIEKNCVKGKQFAYFTSEFDSAFPGTIKIFASTCASTSDVNRH